MTEPVANEVFDPYHKWLGISPRDQPPHYYRLLAIDLFEADLDVISVAADKQMAFIRSFQTGKNAQLSQKILNEIAAARVCLLDTAKKAQYDVALRARMVAAASGINAAKPMPAAAAPVDESVIVLADLAETDVRGLPPIGFAAHHRAAIRGRRLKNFIWSLAALGAMLVACAVAVAVVMLRAPETQVAADPTSSPARNAERHRVLPAASDDNLHVTANSAAPPPKSVFPPIGFNHTSDAANPAAPSKAAIPAVSGNSPNPQPSDKNRPTITPEIGEPVSSDDPFGAQSESPPQPDVPAKAAQAVKTKTSAELDKQLADAKTSDDYQAVALDALAAAAHALDDHQQDAAKQSILTALVAARKSGDSKLIIHATRAVTRPESVKEILAERDKQDGGLADASQPEGSSSRPRKSADGTVETPVNSAAVAKRVGLRGNPRIGLLIRDVRQGTLITLQYENGTWNDPLTQEFINPDDAAQNTYRVAITSRDVIPSVFVVPHGTANRPFQWRAARDYPSLILHCQVSGTAPHLGGTVYYRMTVTRPGP